MQIIEKNSFNVRSAVYRLKKIDDQLEFILFPMIHVGTTNFYDEVKRGLSKCDLILIEGVASKKSALLTLSYRIVRRIKRIGLVTQKEALSLLDLRERVIHVDMQGDTFDNGWAMLPLSVKAIMYCGVPIFVAYLLLFGTRNIIAENISMDDLPSRDEILNSDEEFGKLDSLLVDQRDQIIISKINSLYETSRQENKVVGVVYGAAHMRNIILFLSEKLGYRIVGSEWLTVFDL